MLCLLGKKIQQFKRNIVLLAIATPPAAQVVMISEVIIFNQANLQLINMCRKPEVLSIMLGTKGNIEKELDLKKPVII